MTEKAFHIPVLVQEVIENMKLKPEGVYVDCTVGGAGHSHAMLSVEPSINLFCFDHDEEAIQTAKNRLKEYKSQITFINDNFKNFRSWLALRKINKVDGILMDLGVSNHQISESSRGFSFMENGILDMRMDRKIDTNAFKIVNNYPFEELYKIFHIYGEERYSKRIAQQIVEKRKISEIKTTQELANIVENSVPDKSKVSLIKSKSRIFQALRITVNKELEILLPSLKDAISALKTGGRLLVISWHSLEDRIVKECFRDEASDCRCPISQSLNIPPKPKGHQSCACQHKKRLIIITKKPITPMDSEIQKNSNSRSAKMRVSERKGE
ncbi:MAG: 16S rRNA (cytosine(1402)-N(4))-methyltransferase RsmH [Candidatus Cloacimonetes bacterium]|nr:16S rRNA (cytosine(1402)-N(4))-methyltransferase RsmH [Candidatus Cloacimonadota bacterium]